MKRSLIRQSLPLALSALLFPPQALTQNASIEPVRPGGSIFLRPYSAVEVPEIRPGNSTRYSRLLRAGMLYLSIEDAIALALENNIDLEISRYNPILGQWRLQRAQAGGFLPGVPSTAAQAGSVAAGQGVTGSQQAAGVASGGGGAGGQNTNASIAQIGPVTQTLDPIVQHTSSFRESDTPQANATQSRTNVLTANTRIFNTSIQQGFLSGGSVTLGFRTNYLKENSPTNILNPSTAANLSLTFQHSLLRGFGVAVNARTINIQKKNLAITDLNFRAQATNLVGQVVNQYFGLAGAQEDLRSKQLAFEVAERLRNNVARQVEVGTLAPPELTRAASQVASSRLNFVNAETAVEQQELRLKNLISRNGIVEPQLASARIVTTTRLEIPSAEGLPPVEELVKTANANRADILAARASLETSQLNQLGTKNNVLPNLVAFGAMTNAGLGGTPGGGPPPDPYFVGGLGTAVGQVFRRNFPTDRAGVFFQAPIRNRQAQADHVIDQLQYRQSELRTSKTVNQIEVDVMNSAVGLQQARARYEAAVKNRTLQQELLKAEEKKFDLGASTLTNVIQQQRDAAAAEAAVVLSLVSYINAKVSLNRTLGRTLEAYGVTIEEATRGEVNRAPAVLPPPN